MYLFHTNKGFILINTSAKNGLFCQRFSNSFLPKNVPICSGRLLDYSATLDTNDTIYVATLPDATHLNYYIYEGNRFVPHTLISNEQSNFELSSPIIYTLNHIPYLIYVSHQMLSSTYDFVSENLVRPNLTSLLTLSTQPTHIKDYKTDNEVFIFFVIKDTQYHLNALVITSEGVRHVAYLTTSDPIIDYSVCIEENVVHIVFETELHGKYQLAYLNTMTQKVTTLITTQYPSEPVVFSYYNLIWINATINHKLQTFLSINNGETFSIPVPCTLQNNIKRCSFMTRSVSPFVGQELYVAMAPRPRLCTLAMIDIPHFHMDSKVPVELELLLEALNLKLEQLEEKRQTQQPQTIQQQQTTPPSIQQRPIAPSNPMQQMQPIQQMQPNPMLQQPMMQPNPMLQQPMIQQTPPTRPYTTSYEPQPTYPPRPMPSQASPSQSTPSTPMPNTTPYMTEEEPMPYTTAPPERPYTTDPKQEEEQALESATEAFMEEFNGWDLPPRV